MGFIRRSILRTGTAVTAYGLTSIFVTLALSGTALADVEINAKGENPAGDKVKIMVSGETVNGTTTGRPPGLTGMARLVCALGYKETVIIEGSEASLNTAPSGDPISCPIQLFYDSGSRTININPCDTPPTIGADFGGCTVEVFGENPGDEVKIKYHAEHTVPDP